MYQKMNNQNKMKSSNFVAHFKRYLQLKGEIECVKMFDL